MWAAACIVNESECHVRAQYTVCRAQPWAGVALASAQGRYSVTTPDSFTRKELPSTDTLDGRSWDIRDFAYIAIGLRLTDALAWSRRFR